MNKKSLSKRDICKKLITLALVSAGWDLQRQIREEVAFTADRMFLKSQQLLAFLYSSATGTANQSNVGSRVILDLPFPLRPLGKHQRIVAKVDELMRLCEEFEARLKKGMVDAERLVGAKMTQALERES